MDTLTLPIMNTEFYIAMPKGVHFTWKAKTEKWLQYVAKEWSRFQPNNELSQLNDLKMGETLRISSLLYDCLVQADHYYQLSNGLFSPYLKLQLEQHGYNQSFPFETAKSNSFQNKSFIADQPFQFLGDGQVMKVAQQEIDLGGFAKGYAIEKLAIWLEQEVSSDFGLIDGGGDMKMWSSGEKTWTIGVADAWNIDKEISSIKMKTGAIATSNQVYRSWMQGTKKKHHLLNGQTGEIADTDVLQASVVTSSLCDAEVGAKLCFLMKEDELQQWFEKNCQQSARYLVKEGQVANWRMTGVR
ncbi:MULTISPECIES: FAD:protein FMN transferase [unclassified Lysinibacillus]|uniref:FAD:protein FMN transferase n=1 Tax=unclassified Lysinibacillus TaxID=2636778 RepID=UPI0025536150|nr:MULTISPECIES: FAD:protein FMN transferase [unclassified Lysinibacillus]MDM5248785.1 FAD:protein FMN transferase [Lysinibacillus sp. G4S2]